MGNLNISDESFGTAHARIHARSSVRIQNECGERAFGLVVAVLMVSFPQPTDTSLY